MEWDLFCRVIDNHGDLGVCWRLAADLVTRGESVRLWVDNASALAWMAPPGHAGVSVRPWPDAQAHQPGDVVIEAFGCDLPDAFVVRMARRTPPPVWINLEYLSAEAYVERSHGLPSPQQSGPGAGLTKWFFYPGFASATGGLLREPDLLARQAAFDATAWLAAHGLQRRRDERIWSLFCYDNPALPDLLEALPSEPTLLLVTPGPAARQVSAVLGAALARGALRAVLLPYLSQRDYDHLLWSCDLNLVRGEDSFVRAQWAGVPFVWQIYPQHDGAHLVKLDAFLARHLAGVDADLAQEVAALWRGWNGGRATTLRWPAAPTWSAQCRAWRAQLLALPDLTTGLIRCAREKS